MGLNERQVDIADRSRRAFLVGGMVAGASLVLPRGVDAAVEQPKDAHLSEGRKILPIGLTMEEVKSSLMANIGMPETTDYDSRASVSLNKADNNEVKLSKFLKRGDMAIYVGPRFYIGSFRERPFISPDPKYRAYVTIVLADTDVSTDAIWNPNDFFFNSVATTRVEGFTEEETRNLRAEDARRVAYIQGQSLFTQGLGRFDTRVYLARAMANNPNSYSDYGGRDYYPGWNYIP